MRVGFLQLRPKFGAVKTNVHRAVTLLGKVSDATIVLPELFNTGYLFKNEEELAQLAERVPEGYTTREMKRIAKKNNLHLIFGIAQKSARRFYNAAVHVSPKGTTHIYQKVHLFDREKLFFQRGKSLKVVGIPEARLGLMICFDWIYPELTRVLALQGAQILCHPANLILPYCQDAMKTRCIENRVFAITANRIGTERRGTVMVTFAGGSQVISPRGEVLTSAGDRSESLKVVDINVSEADDKNVTPTNNIFEDRAYSLYRPLCRKPR